VGEGALHARDAASSRRSVHAEIDLIDPADEPASSSHSAKATIIAIIDDSVRCYQRVSEARIVTAQLQPPRYQECSRPS
jgi:hypothetical protein